MPPRPLLALIAAMSTNRVIGRDGDMPWHLPEDLAYFKKVTQGRAIIMGRRTWESLGRPLPKRRNIVVTSHDAANFPGAEVAPSLAAALEMCQSDEIVFCIGGGQLYRAALPMADMLYLTEIQKDIAGDTFFPEVEASQWRVIDRQAQSQQDAPVRFEFVTYVRKRAERPADAT